MEIRLDVHGDVQVSRRLLRSGRHAKDARPALRAIARDWMDVEREQFASEGARASGGWAPLAPSTLARKQGPRILHETGDLLASLTGNDAILELSEGELLFGSTVPYLKYHQRGTEKMPQRRPIELTERDRRDAVRRLQRWIVRGEVR